MGKEEKETNGRIGNHLKMQQRRVLQTNEAEKQTINQCFTEHHHSVSFPYQETEGDRGGDVGSSYDSATHMRRVDTALELDAFNLGQRGATVLPNKLLGCVIEARGINGRRDHILR